MFKVFKGEKAETVNEIFSIRNKASYKLLQRSCFHIPSVNTFLAVQEVYNFSIRKSGNLFQLISNAS